MTITIDGVLAQDARAHAWGVGGYAVTLRICGGANSAPFEVRVDCGKGPDASLRAERMARPLRAGSAVRATGTRLDTVSDHGDARFALRECSSVMVEGVALV